MADWFPIASDNSLNEIRILIVADNLLARTGLATLLNEYSVCDVIAQVDGHDLLHDLDVYQPDMVLVDLGWNTESLLDCVNELVDGDWTVVALLSDDEDTITKTLSVLRQFSAYGALLRDSATEMLVAALQGVDNGLVVLDPSLTDALAPLESALIPSVEALTPREDEVLQLLAKGMTNKAIAHELGITEHTVKFHVTAIMTKLQAQSRTEAVVTATRLGWVLL